LGGVVAAECRLTLERKLGSGQTRGPVVHGSAVGGVCIKDQRAQWLAAQCEAVERGVRFEIRIVDSAGPTHREAERAGGFGIPAVQGIDLRQIDAGAAGIDLETAGFQVIAAAGIQASSG